MLDNYFYILSASKDILVPIGILEIVKSEYYYEDKPLFLLCCNGKEIGLYKTEENAQKELYTIMNVFTKYRYIYEVTDDFERS